MPNIDLSILNQRQTPAFYADTLANRPAAGFVGRIFVSTNTFAFYRDNGTGWDLIGGPGTGTITGSGTNGQIALWDGASTITGDTGLTYNGTDNSLTASKFIVTGGTSSQFLKADGSVDSSSYVPYTGATASLDMGLNNLLGQNFLIRGNNTNSGGYLGLRQFNGSSSGSNGYTSISALQQNSLYFQYSQTDGSNKVVELSTALLGTTPRQFLFPNADGTFALTSNIPSVSGAAGQVSYFNGTNSITGSNDLFWDSVNGHLGVNTNVPGTALDVHHDQSTVAILNQTVATNDVRIGFQNNGVGLWRIGAFYNAGANDFGIYDAVAALQPVTVKKTTGQVLIGTSTVGSGKLVVASNIGDNGIQIVGASAPSLRIDSAESGPTKRAGLGISTATNNFIQGSADRDFCIFNGSTAAASPILFGIYDAGAVNVQEAARISPARNFLLGTTTDSGYKLNVNGTSYFVGGLTFVDRFNSLNGSANRFYRADNAAYTEMYDAGSLAANGFTFNNTNGEGFHFKNGATTIIRMPSNNNVGIGTTTPTQKLHVLGNAIFNNSSFGSANIRLIGTGTTTGFDIIADNDTGGLWNRDNNYMYFGTNNTERLRILGSGEMVFKGASTTTNLGAIFENSNSTFYIYGTEGAGTTKDIRIQSGGSASAPRVWLKAGGNFLVGTDTDAGQKLQVNGRTKTQGLELVEDYTNTLTTSSAYTSFTTVIPTNTLTVFGVYLITAKYAVNNTPYNVHASFLFCTLNTNGSGGDFSNIPLNSTHQGSGAYMEFCSVAGGSQVCNGLQVKFNGFADPNGTLTITATFLKSL